MHVAIRFEYGKPVEVALKFATGLAVKSSLYDKAQVMFTLMDDEKMYVDLPVAERIHALQPARGDRLVVCKRRVGKTTAWDVTRWSASGPDGVSEQDVPPFAPASAEIARTKPVRLAPGGGGITAKLLARALRAAAAILEGGE